MSILKKFLISTAVFFVLIGFCTGFAYADGARLGVVNTETLNVRQSPGTSAEILTKLSKATQVVILESSNGWYKISCGNTIGWLCAQYVSVKDTATDTGVITGDKVNLRSSPSLSAGVVARLEEGANVSVFGRSGEWYNIKTSGGEVGWVFKEFISLKNSSAASRGDIKVTNLPKSVSGTVSTVGQKMVDFAKKYLGVKYVYGGNTPKGFDCSGFTKYVYNNFGIDIQRVAADQAKQGVKISKSGLQPGDLVFFDTDGGHNHINHVGLYIGDGNFIHASSGRSSHRVTISELSDGFYANAFMSAKRFTK